jgi:hypothetical protein
MRFCHVVAHTNHVCLLFLVRAVSDEMGAAAVEAFDRWALLLRVGAALVLVLAFALPLAFAFVFALALVLPLALALALVLVLH